LKGLFDASGGTVLEGTIERVVYRPLDGDFAVIRLRRSDGSLMTAAGPLGAVRVGETVRLAGHFETHPTYGRQFKAASFESRPPSTEEGLRAFIEGPAFKGVGPKTAERLLGAFGTALLEEGRDEAVLMDRAGLSPAKARAIARQIARVGKDEETDIFFLSLGLRPRMIQRIRRALGDQAVEEARSNPYRLTEVVEGIGFRRADALARRLGVGLDSEARLQAAILFCLREAQGEGHTFQSVEDMEARLTALEVPFSNLLEEAKSLTSGGQVSVDGDRFYLTALLGAESRAARLLGIRMSRRPFPRKLKASGPGLSEIQTEAVLMALRMPFSVLTGGPGTGKTTTIKGIVTEARSQGLRLALTAPSGRAARRMVEATGHPAQTLHRLLKLKPGTFHAETVVADLVVVDESSMLDIQLFEALLSAVPPRCGLLLVGDADQLPPVGPGAPFRDIVRSDLAPVMRLEEIYRQSKDSYLAENAHRIREGQFPRGGGRDFIWHRVEDQEKAQALVVELAKEEVERFGMDDVEVLTAGNRFLLGTQELNTRLQGTLNRSETSFRAGSLTVRPGDKVLQRKNNYRLGVFNGEVGRVVGRQGIRLLVRFPSPEGEMEVAYDEDALDHLSLGYALTVHKAQGSEFPVVIAVLSTQHFPLLRRNLLYTAVTRAKARLHLVASAKAVALALRNREDDERRGAFDERLGAALKA